MHETDAPPRLEPFPQRLIEGYDAFIHGSFQSERQRYRELAQRGQKPRIMLVGCCDSRCAPELIFDAHPGEMFVLRNVANLIPPYQPNDDFHGTSSALEFAVMGLRIEHIVIMGHAQCGGVRAYAEGERDPYQRPLSPGDFIGSWMKLIAPAAEKLGPPTDPIEDYAERLAKESVKQTIENLRSFPCVKTLEGRGRLHLHGAYFGVLDGNLLILDPASGEFIPAAPQPADDI